MFYPQMSPYGQVNNNMLPGMFSLYPGGYQGSYQLSPQLGDFQQGRSTPVFNQAGWNMAQASGPNTAAAQMARNAIHGNGSGMPFVPSGMPNANSNISIQAPVPQYAPQGFAPNFGQGSHADNKHRNIGRTPY